MIDKWSRYIFSETWLNKSERGNFEREKESPVKAQVVKFKGDVNRCLALSNAVEVIISGDTLTPVGTEGSGHCQGGSTGCYDRG